MKVLFLTEQGDGIGYGHVSRCTALADGFSEYNCDMTIVSRGFPGEYILDRNYNFFNKEWNSNSFLENYLQEFDIVVADSYQVSDSILRFIGEHSKLPVYLVDSTMRYYPAGIVLFPSTYADSYDFNKSRGINILKGKEFLLFTKEFWDISNIRLRKRVSRIGISLGGIANKAVIDLLITVRTHMPNLKEISIFGELDEEVKKKIETENYNIRGFLNKKQYIEEVRHMDVMICNGGQTLNECILLGIPTISLICADNQENNSKTWEGFDITSSIDVRQGLDKIALKEKLLEIASYKDRLEINKKCKEIIDHKGAVRSAKQILKIANAK